MLYKDFAQFSYIENGELKGVSVEILKTIFRYPKVRALIPRMPEFTLSEWARTNALLDTKPNIIYLGMGLNHTRKDNYNWLRFVGNVDIGLQLLTAAARDDISPIRSVDDIIRQNLTIGTEDDKNIHFLTFSGLGVNI